MKNPFISIFLYNLLYLVKLKYLQNILKYGVLL